MPKHQESYNSRSKTSASTEQRKNNSRSSPNAEQLNEDFEHGTALRGTQRTATQNQPQHQREVHIDDNDRYGYDSDRGIYGHYHVQTHDGRADTQYDRERGLQNAGPDLISDYGAGEGRGRFDGRDVGHNYANEFYEDADNERLREARRNHAFRHGYDESDMRDRDDFAPGQTRGVSPGFVEVNTRQKKTSGAKNRSRRKKTAAKSAKRTLRKTAKAKKESALKKANKKKTAKKRTAAKHSKRMEARVTRAKSKRARRK